ncbi:MAG: hypothetical protein HY905_18990 [Deltaproteobacteria bacterium]|nr:hypothetical protein [Deltaproteobacteria bacterium]
MDSEKPACVREPRQDPAYHGDDRIAPEVRVLDRDASRRITRLDDELTTEPVDPLRSWCGAESWPVLRIEDVALDAVPEVIALDEGDVCAGEYWGFQVFGNDDGIWRAFPPTGKAEECPPNNSSLFTAASNALELSCVDLGSNEETRRTLRWTWDGEYFSPAAAGGGADPCVEGLSSSGAGGVPAHLLFCADPTRMEGTWTGARVGGKYDCPQRVESDAAFRILKRRGWSEVTTWAAGNGVAGCLPGTRECYQWVFDPCFPDDPSTCSPRIQVTSGYP